MSASAQAHAFYKDVSKNGVVYTIGINGAPQVANNPNGGLVMPLWSTESRVKKIIATVPAYARCTVLSCSWQSFQTEWLPALNEKEISIGVNWSGKNASGFNMPANLVVEQVNASNK